MTRCPLVVFAGPSLNRSDRASGAIDWRPPAKAGDIALLLRDPPQRVCLVDGFFDSVPAPWHKELLLLMAAGTRVFGASSMGALRAAELDRHGMIGIGRIYEAYRDGRLTGDDEVALVHAPERLDWVAVSVPLVELRATLAAAARCGLVSVAAARAMRQTAAALHFSERDWAALRWRWMEGGHCTGEIADAVARLHVPLKRMDALACLRAALDERPCGPPPPAPPRTCFVKDLLGSLPPPV